MIDSPANTVKVTARWAPSEGIFLWGTTSSGSVCDAGQLKDWLFAWHKPSFYGTFIEDKEWMDIDGLLLRPLEALDVLCELPDSIVRHVVLEYSKELQDLLTAAPAVKEALAQGKFMPDFAKWKSGKLGWKLQLAEPAAVLAASPTVSPWLEALTPAWVEQDDEMREQLRRLERALPLRAPDTPAALWMDEEDWLLSIGWHSDGTPFRTCLKLEEPAHPDAPWPLKLVLQDRMDRSQQLELPPSKLEEALQERTAFEELPLSDTAALPAEWLPHGEKASRTVSKWLRILPWLADSREELRNELSGEEAWRLLSEGSLRLMEAGSSIILPAWWERIRKRRPRLRAKIKSSVGAAPQSLFGMEQMMQFDWKIALGGTELTEEEYKALLSQGRHLVQVNGQWVQLDPEHIREMDKIMISLSRREGLTFREILGLHLLSSSEDDNEPHLISPFDVELDGQLQELVSMLNHAQRPPMADAPRGFVGTLRPYQLEGISWLLFLRECGLGACLADDMGLGKTVQMISYLLHIKTGNGASSKRPLPSLLICPTSVLGNWQKELERFSPSLKVHLHYGPRRHKGEDFAETAEAHDLVLTSYALAHLDESELGSVSWDAVCLDEAQNIKNSYTKQAAAIRKLSGQHRIALTGTPIENRLTELWSIFDFLNPGYLGTLSEFNERFVQAVERAEDHEAASKVQRLIRPFLLRRLKKDPAIQLSLPDKYEYKTYVSLTPEQAALYENYIHSLFEGIDRLKAMERRGIILGALTKFKQLCNHPSLFTKEPLTPNWRGRSNKLDRLLEMVQELRQDNDRCLIFTQFVDTGKLLQHAIEEELEQPVFFLHGGTPKAARDEMIESFQSSGTNAASDSEGTAGIFILSLKAGGTGLNLTAANHVFHFDRWWNPAVENQATDRAFRIGQTRQVQVHKFVTLGTLEERIDEMIDKKLALSEQIVGGGEQWITELSTDDLRELFALRNEWV